jgi:predicted aldo/keto reductase-like oxidoreductase
MNYRTLGRTGLQVSEVGMGSEGFEGKSFSEVNSLVALCFEQGVNYFDMYNPNPATRENFGKATAGQRNKYIIQGHIGSAWQDNQYLRTREMTLVKASFDDLLSRLGTDFVDVGMIHFIDKQDDLDVIMNGPFIKYVLELKTSGAIHFIGFSSHNADVAAKAIETGLFDVMMFSLNPAYDMRPGSDIIEDLFEEKNYKDNSLSGMDVNRERLYRTCEAKNVAITVMKPFAGGMLLDAARSPFEVPLTTIQCLHYALTRPAVASVLAGCFTQEEIRDVARYSECSIEEKDYSVALSSAPRHSYSGKCMYCGHCAPCAVGIDIAAVNKYLDLSHSFTPETVSDHYALLDHHASECIGCGQCEPNCPFGVDIIDRMAKAAEIFGN